MAIRKIYLSNPVCSRSGVKLSETTWKDHLITCGIPYMQIPTEFRGIPENFTAKKPA
jgi:hypothetical protein